MPAPKTPAEENADIIRMAQRLEHQLAARGGLGRGLGEYAHSLRGELPSEVMRDVMRVNRVRNDLVHRNIDWPLSQREREKIALSYQRASAYLGAGEEGAPRPQRSWPWALALALTWGLVLLGLALAFF